MPILLNKTLQYKESKYWNAVLIGSSKKAGTSPVSAEESSRITLLTLTTTHTQNSNKPPLEPKLI